MSLVPLDRIIVSETAPATYSWERFDDHTWPTYTVDGDELLLLELHPTVVNRDSGQQFQTSSSAGGSGPNTEEVQVCVLIEPDYDDFGPKDGWPVNNYWDLSDRDDYYNVPTAYVARGGHILVQPNSGWLYGKALNWDVGVPEPGAMRGCTLLHVARGGSALIWLHSGGTVDDIRFDVKDDRNRGRLSSTYVGSVAVANDGTVTYDPHFLMVARSHHVAFNLTSILGFALSRRRLPMDDGVEAFWDARDAGSLKKSSSNKNRLFIHPDQHRVRVHSGA